MGERIRITDVSPRDGLQNEAGIIPTAEKVELVRLLCQTGVDEVEVTSFVSPKWVPQLGDAGDLCDLIANSLFLSPQSPPAVKSSRNCPAFSALVPNERGMQGLLDANARSGHRLVEKASVFTAASETFCLKNTNASIAETIDRFVPVILAAKREGLQVRGYVSCVIACPFEGAIRPEAVIYVAKRLLDLGVDEIDLGDTIGAATAESTSTLLQEIHRSIGRGWTDRGLVTLHLHDTFGRAAECVKVALDLGIRSFDGSVGGLGGCPYASTPSKRAPGNIATHTLVKTIHEAGYTTGVDLAKLDEAAAFATKIVAASRARAASASRGGQP